MTELLMLDSWFERQEAAERTKRKLSSLPQRVSRYIRGFPNPFISSKKTITLDQLQIIKAGIANIPALGNDNPEYKTGFPIQLNMSTQDKGKINTNQNVIGHYIKCEWEDGTWVLVTKFPDHKKQLADRETLRIVNSFGPLNTPEKADPSLDFISILNWGIPESKWLDYLNDNKKHFEIFSLSAIKYTPESYYLRSVFFDVFHGGTYRLGAYLNSLRDEIGTVPRFGSPNWPLDTSPLSQMSQKEFELVDTLMRTYQSLTGKSAR